MEPLNNIIKKIELKKLSKNLVSESFKTLSELVSKEALTYNSILRIATEKASVAKYDMNNGEYSGEIYRNKKGYSAIFFDNRTGNFHIMPDEVNVLNECSMEISDKFSKIKKVLQKKVNEKIDEGWKYEEHLCQAQTQYHKLFAFLRIIVRNERAYDLMFFRMALDEKEKNVSCILKSIQYECSSGNLYSCTIYPESLEDDCEKTDDKGNCYYNPSVSFYDDVDRIIDDFINFIKEKEKHYALLEIRKPQDLYIIHKSFVDATTKQLLKLNRKTESLELYMRAENNVVLHDYYNIRKNFDSSDYYMYKMVNSFSCIFGGQNTPTPSGIFKIEKISKEREEYISGYHPAYQKVKFFGYLVIFEDYFIHSNMYLEEVTKDTLDKAGTISKADEHTSGCIRVSQADLDWLVKNIKEGTTVIM